jgi:hypothetical protein
MANVLEALYEALALTPRRPARLRGRARLGMPAFVRSVALAKLLLD